MLCCSKFKQISPTKLEDLIRFQPNKYKEINQRELETLTEGDLVQASLHLFGSTILDLV